MKKVSLTWLLSVVLTSLTFAQEQTVVEKLQDFFFAFPINSNIEVLRSQLSELEGFRFYADPNRDATRTITGTFGKNKRLNPVANSNQLIIMFWGTKPKWQNVSIRWAINYKLEDLAAGLYDYEKMIVEFQPYFTDVIRKEELGQHQETIRITTLRSGSMVISVRIIEYNNLIHTVSLEYRDVWRIPTGPK